MTVTEAWTEGEAAALEVIERQLPEQVREGLVLEVVDVSVRFGGVQALRAVSLSVPAKGFVGLIGPNGSGKTTLFDVINGFTTADGGRVVAFGQPIDRLRPWDRARLGLCRTFQANHISPELTVSDNLLAGSFLNVRGGVVRSVLPSRAVRGDRTRAVELAGAVARLLGLEEVAEVRAGASVVRRPTPHRDRPLPDVWTAPAAPRRAECRNGCPRGAATDHPGETTASRPRLGDLPHRTLRANGVRQLRPHPCPRQGRADRQRGCDRVAADPRGPRGLSRCSRGDRCLKSSE